MYPFSKITPVPGAQIGNSPARCNRRTKQVWTNQDLWPKLSDNARHFILYHEAGHIVLNTKDEFSADEYAFQRMMKEGRSLQDCVKALTQLLSNSEGHRKRAYLQLQRAKTYDLINNKNTNMQGLQPYYPSQQTESFLGIGRRKYKGMSKSERKEAQRQESIDKLAYNKRKRELRNEGKTIKNQSRLILAEQGVDQKQGSIVGDIAGLASGILGGGSSRGGGGGNDGGGGGETIQQAVAPSYNNVARGSMAENVAPNVSYQPYQREAPSANGGATTDPKAKDKNNMLFIVGGVVLAVVVVVIIVLIKKK